MKGRKVAFGSGMALLILLLVTLAISVLGLLNWISCRSEFSLAERNIRTAVEVYDLRADSEKTLSEVDACLEEARRKARDNEEYLEIVESTLPERVSMAGNEIRWEEVIGNRSLICEIRVLDKDDASRYAWKTRKVQVDMGMPDDVNEAKKWY